MILILSRKGDNETNKVCGWIESKKEKYFVIEDYNSLVEFINSKGTINNSLSIITTIWLRKKPVLNMEDYQDLTGVEQYQLKQEFSTILEFITNSDKPILRGEISNLNKLNILEQAKKVGLLIPPYIVCSRKENLSKFVIDHKEVITKPLSEPVFVRVDGKVYGQHTKLITQTALKEISDDFFPSLFQKYIEPLHELRVIYVKPQFTAISIRPQLTKVMKHDDIVDQRFLYGKNLLSKKYNLPSEIQEKLKILVSTLNFQTCSIDIIVDSLRRHLFLELNPSGQFNFFSDIHNLHIPRQIAAYLITTSNEYKKTVSQK